MTPVPVCTAAGGPAAAADAVGAPAAAAVDPPPPGLEEPVVVAAPDATVPPPVVGSAVDPLSADPPAEAAGVCAPPPAVASVPFDERWSIVGSRASITTQTVPNAYSGMYRRRWNDARSAPRAIRLWVSPSAWLSSLRLTAIQHLRGHRSATRPPRRP